MLGLVQDLRHAQRRLFKAPGFAFTAIVTLSLGIGATTLVYSVVQSVLLNSLAFPHADRLMVIAEEQDGSDFSVAWPNFEDWRSQAKSFTGMAAYDMAHFQFFDGAHTILPRAARVTAAFFPILDVQPVAGRVFTESEDRPGGPQVVVLNYDFWQTHASRIALGNTIDLSGQPYTVIGVMPPHFQYFFGHAEDFYLPLGQLTLGAGFHNRTEHDSIRVVARLRNDTTVAGARTEMAGIAARLAAQYPDSNKGHSVEIEKLTDNYFGEIRPVLWLLLAAVLLVLLVACANISNLLLARGAERSREYAIRSAMGAGAYRIFRQSLADSLVLALIGGGCGVLLAFLGLPLLLRLAPQGIPRLERTEISLPVLVFALALSLFVALLCSILPAFASTRIGPNQALRTSTTMGTRGRQLVRNALLVGGVAVTVILTAATGLLVQSLRQALSSDPGFEPEHLLSLDIVLSDAKYKNSVTTAAFWSAAADQVRTVPGVEAVGSSMCPPMAGDCWDYFYSIPGRMGPNESDLPISLFNVADTSYFRTTGIRLLKGRTFSDSDTATSRHVAVVNRIFADRWWPAGDAVGHTLRMGGRGEPGDLLEIVGVVDAVRQFGLDAAPEPEVFFPYAQQPRDTMVLMARTAGNPAALAATAEDAIHRVDREVPVRIHPMSTVVTDSLRQRKFLVLLFSIFGGITLFLAGLGIFGVAAYFVASRRTEIGLRVALGAKPQQLEHWVSGQVARSAALGCAIGVVGSFAVLRVIRSQLYLVSPADPLVLGAAAALLILIAFVAAWVPARRATSIEPMEALRAE